MKKHRAICLAIACLLFVVFAYAGPKDFWVIKPYTDWTAAEVVKILQKNCPWTHVLLLIPSEGGGRGSTRSPNPSYSLPVYITWNSRVAREAIVRKTMLEVPDTPKEQIDQVLSYSPKHIEIFVNGQEMGGGRGASSTEAMAEFKERTFLQKKNKEKLPLLDIVVQGRGGSLTLLFAREVDGKPTIVPEDKEVTLMIRIGESNYKFNFKLQDMMVNGKLEI